MSDEEKTTLFDVWQMNMINCCNFEIQFLPLEHGTMLVLLPDGKFLLEFGNMLRKDSKCFTFVVENTHMLCAGHPQWDSKKPGQNVEGFKWDKVHEEEAKKNKKKKVSF